MGIFGYGVLLLEPRICFLFFFILYLMDAFLYSFLCSLGMSLLHMVHRIKSNNLIVKESNERTNESNGVVCVCVCVSSDVREKRKPNQRYLFALEDLA